MTPTTLSLPLLVVALAACSSDDTASTDSATDSATSVSGTTAPTTTATTSGASSTTDASGSMSESATMGSTDATTSTGGETTSVVTATTSTSSTTSGGPSCGDGVVDDGEICDPPGTPTGQCSDGASIEVCNGSCDGYEPESCGANAGCINGECVDNLCSPGSKSCVDEDTFQTCAGDGQSWENPTECGPTEGCSAGECVPLCDLVLGDPSSIGCSFLANRMDNYFTDQPDSLIVGNTSQSKSANVQFYFMPNNSNVEQAQGGPINVAPGKTYSFTLSNLPPDKVSALRVGGTYRVQSDIPIIAYQHSPIGQQYTNDASMLLPEHAMRSNHIVASYRASVGNYPSYFNVIALENDTTVSWTPKVATAAGGGVPAVAANQTGMVKLNRGDLLQVRVANQNDDMSGTYVTGDGKPIWVVGATECANVPAGVTYCDHIEEQIFPLDYWGKEYVGAHSPKRNNEKHYWRVFAGEDDTQIVTEPPQPGTPIALAKQGDYKDITVANSVSFVFKTANDKPFLAVQYLSGSSDNAGTGDPSMYQMVPTEQFLSSYAFVTGTNYPTHYVQVIRQAGGADVTVDGAVVGGYYTIGAYEVADWKISEGSHFATSGDNFGIVGIGYAQDTSYAYPGGLRLKVINPQ
ncbi:MAG: IgGFc-binding protein [Myxococcales bacterium]|nr:IgGFc-binding protein [Myxococcales bacterium]